MNLNVRIFGGALRGYVRYESQILIHFYPDPAGPRLSGQSSPLHPGRRDRPEVVSQGGLRVEAADLSPAGHVGC